jgi:membrane dipeptidase
MAEPPIIDLHAHPSMKSFFGKSDFARFVVGKKGFNPFGMRTNLPKLAAGGIQVLWSSIYVPEKDLRDDCFLFKGIPLLLLPALRKALSTPADKTAMAMLKRVEIMVDDANNANLSAGLSLPKATVATSINDMETAIARDEIVLVHTIEGAHVLENDLANLDRFADRGVASMTLAHFYENGVAPPVDAVPDDMFLKKLGCFKKTEDLSLGLASLGEQLVEKMFDIGMIVDLTHSTPKARADVLAISNPKNRPLVMSHVGARSLMNHPINPSDDEIRKIADTGGVIGVIFYNEWLTNTDFRKNRNDKLVHVVETIKHMATIGGEDCVALGSDFDGMTDPPDDLKDPGDLPNLTTALRNSGFTDIQIDKVANKNAMRVMKDGWR